jgi:hypothetical protein
MSTLQRPMNGSIKRYIDLIYPDQKYKDKMEEMIDKVKNHILLMRNIEKEKERLKALKITPEEKVQKKKEIKQELAKVPFTQISKFYKQYIKNRKEGKAESKEDKQKNKIYI